MRTVYFDFETGGLLDQHPSIQLAAVAIDDESGEELGAFEQKIQFDESGCDPEALKLNGYSAEAWKDAVSSTETARRFSLFLKPWCCIEMVSKRTGAPYSVAKMAGYNALTFDWPRLKALFGTAFLPCSYHVRDVLQRAMFWFDERPTVSRPENLKLGTVAAYFGLSPNGSHEALADVRTTANLARRLRS